MSKYEARSLFGVTISFLLSVVIGGPFHNYDIFRIGKYVY